MQQTSQNSQQPLPQHLPPSSPPIATEDSPFLSEPSEPNIEEERVISAWTRHSNLSHKLRELLCEAEAYTSWLRRSQCSSRTPSHHHTSCSSLPTSIVNTACHYNRESVAHCDDAKSTPDAPALPTPTPSRIGTQYRRKLSLEEKEKAFQKELASCHKNNAFYVTPLKDVLPNVNMVGSHTTFRSKDYGPVKARIVPWGYRDVKKDDVRSNSPCVSLDFIRLVLSVSSEFGWCVGQIDVKTAYLHSKGFSAHHLKWKCSEKYQKALIMYSRSFF